MQSVDSAFDTLSNGLYTMFSLKEEQTAVLEASEERKELSAASAQSGVTRLAAVIGCRPVQLASRGIFGLHRSAQTPL